MRPAMPRYDEDDEDEAPARLRLRDDDEDDDETTTVTNNRAAPPAVTRAQNRRATVCHASMIPSASLASRAAICGFWHPLSASSARQIETDWHRQRDGHRRHHLASSTSLSKPQPFATASTGRASRPRRPPIRFKSGYRCGNAPGWEEETRAAKAKEDDDHKSWRRRTKKIRRKTRTMNA